MTRPPTLRGRQNYEEYLRSTRWQILRGEALQRFDNRCALCYDDRNLEVHHRTYDRLGDEEISDLVALCSWCHGKHHDQLGAFSEGSS